MRNLPGMIIARFLLITCCAIGSAASAAQPSTPFKCEGPFARDTSHVRLAKEFGPANIDTEYDGEFDAQVTILFPSDPQRRLKIKWKDEKGRRKPASVGIEGTNWSAAGVALATPLAEVERLNGGPFKLGNFEGDYGGEISDWMGGRLKAPFSSGCEIWVRIWVAEKFLNDKALNAEVAPDGSLLSSGAGLRATKPTVNEIIVIYPK